MEQTREGTALSREFWAGVRDKTRDICIYEGQVGIGFSYVSGGARHEVAALCLHEQPYGFTRDDVQYLRALATNQDEVSYMMGGRGHSPLTNLADRIEALLPPPPSPLLPQGNQE